MQIWYINRYNRLFRDTTSLYPCSKEGKKQLEKAKQSCYVYGKDFGCGHQCMDEMLNSSAESLA